MLSLRGALPARYPGDLHPAGPRDQISPSWVCAARRNENVNFAKSFWWSAKTFGRTDERLVTALYYLSFGFKEGWQRGMDNSRSPSASSRSGRMHIGLPHRIKGRKGCRRSSPRPTKSRPVKRRSEGSVRHGRRQDRRKDEVSTPGCSLAGQRAAISTSSLRAIPPELGIELDDIEDWNCCGASVGHVGGGALPNMALTGRNLAKARERQGTQDVITGCAACYLNTHGGNEKIKADVNKRQKSTRRWRRAVSPMMATSRCATFARLSSTTSASTRSRSG